MGASRGSIKSENAAQRGEFPARDGAYLSIFADVLRAQPQRRVGIRGTAMSRSLKACARALGTVPTAFLNLPS